MKTLLLLLACVTVAVEASLFGSWWTTTTTTAGERRRSPRPIVRLRASPPAAVRAGRDVALSEMRQLAATHSCWRDAIAALQDSCEKALSSEDQRSRLALQLAGCQLELDGKISSAAHLCSPSQDIRSCVSVLDATYYSIYVQFRLHADTLCFYLQEEAFHQRTEDAVVALNLASENATATLADVADRSASLFDVVEYLSEQQRLASAAAAALHTDFVARAVEHNDTLRMLSLSAERIAADVNSTYNATLVMHDAQRMRLTGMNATLASLAEMQQAALAATARVTQSLHELLSSSAEELTQHRAILADISSHAAALAKRNAESESRIEKISGDVVDALGQILATQRALLGSFAAVDTLVFYVGSAIAVLLLTVPARTASARFLCMVVLVVCAAMEPSLREGQSGIVDSLLFALSTLPPHIAFRRVVTAVEVLMWFVAAWRYQSPLDQQRAVIRVEVNQALARHEAMFSRFLEACAMSNDVAEEVYHVPPTLPPAPPPSPETKRITTAATASNRSRSAVATTRSSSSRRGLRQS